MFCKCTNLPEIADKLLQCTEKLTNEGSMQKWYNLFNVTQMFLQTINAKDVPFLVVKSWRSNKWSCQTELVSHTG